MSWQGDALEVFGVLPAGAAPWPLLQPWRSPVASAAHRNLTWHAYCEYSGAGAVPTLQLDCAAGGAGFPVAVPAAPGWITGVTSTGLGPPWYDDLTLTHTRDAGQIVTVYAFGVEVDALGSPLSTAPVDTAAGGRFVGLGSATLAGDYPLSAARLRTLVEDTAELMALPRLHMGWAGVSDIVNAAKSLSLQRLQPSRPYAVLPRHVPGPLQVHALCRAQAAATTLVLQVPGRDLTLTVPPAPPLPASPDTWVSGVVEPSPSLDTLPDMPVHYTVEVQADILAAAPACDARVLSLSVWGP
jgi:hypothetical protein